MGMDRQIVSGVCVAVGVALWAVTASAQVGSGAIRGVVTDSSGGVLAAAVVAATNLETSGTGHTVTTTAGVYTMPGLVPGTYRLDVSKAGYQATRHEAIRVETGRTIRVDTNLNQLTVEQLAMRETLLQRVPNPFFGTIPRSSSLGDPHDYARAAPQAVP